MRKAISKSTNGISEALVRTFVNKTKKGVAVRFAGDDEDTEICGISIRHGELHVIRKSDKVRLVVMPEDEIVEVDDPAEFAKKPKQD